MILRGQITLDGESIGTFKIDVKDLDFYFNKGAAGMGETLEFAAENGMTLALAVEPPLVSTIEQTQELEDPTPTERRLSGYAGFIYGDGRTTL